MRVAVDIAGDDEFLPQRAFGLEPIARAAFVIGHLHTFGDHAFERQVAGLLEDLGAMGDDVIGIDQRPARVLQEIAQRIFAVGQFGAAPILAVAIEQIEHDVTHRLGLAARQRVLQRGEARSAILVEYRDLAVEREIAAGQLRDRVGDRLEAPGPVERVARQQRDLAVAAAREDAIAVDLDLMQPLIAARRPIDKRRERRRNEIGQWAAFDASGA